jgi:hypothetical protein
MLREADDDYMPWPGFLLGQTPGSCNTFSQTFQTVHFYCLLYFPFLSQNIIITSLVKLKNVKIYIPLAFSTDIQKLIKKIRYNNVLMHASAK